jgi:hypothetical protein
VLDRQIKFLGAYFELDQGGKSRVALSVPKAWVKMAQMGEDGEKCVVVYSELAYSGVIQHASCVVRQVWQRQYGDSSKPGALTPQRLSTFEPYIPQAISNK